MVNTVRNILAIAAVILSVSCTDRNTDKTERTFAPVFKASFSDDSTKVFIDSGKKFKWNADDRISVFGSTSGNEYAFGGETGDNTGLFSIVSGVAPAPSFSHYYSISPYSASNVCTSEGNFKVTLPAAQSFADGHIDSNIMIAVTESLSDNDLKFRNAVSYAEINVFSKKGYKLRRITFSGNDGEVISGDAVLTASYGSSPVLTMTGDGKEIVVDCGDAVLGKTPETANSFRVVLPPISFGKGFKVVCETSDGHMFERSTSKEIELVRNRVQPMAAFNLISIYTELNGTPIDPKNNLIGIITDQSTGNPLKDIPVTDGFHVCTTDANGVYQMQADPRAYTVSYTLPNNYRAPLDPTTHLPVFYANDIDLDDINRRDFALVPCAVENNFTFSAIGDVHIGRSTIGIAEESKRYRDELLGDMAEEYYNGIRSGKYSSNVYAFTLGDLTNDNLASQWSGYYSATHNLKMADGTYIPFYQTMGNHDRRNVSDFFEGRKNYCSYFGPVNYSINIGKAHIIVFDDAKSGSPYTINDDSYNWVVEDLAQVKDKSDKLVLFFCHVPFRSGKTLDGSASVTTHRDDILNMLKQFRQAHMFTGHTHRVQEWINDDFKTESGYPIYEHVHAMTGGHYWMRRISPDGSPFAYSIYTVEGNEIVDFQFKGADFTTDYQMRVYDGNQEIVNPQSNKFYWYRTDNLVDAANGYYAIGDPVLKGAFVITIWKSDTENWKFEFWQNGSYVADLQRVPSNICDVFTASWFWGGNYGNYDCIRKDTQHYFYYKPASLDPSSEKNWTIKAIHTVPSSKGVKHTYECSTITKTYDGFAW